MTMTEVSDEFEWSVESVTMISKLGQSVRQTSKSLRPMPRPKSQNLKAKKPESHGILLILIRATLVIIGGNTISITVKSITLAQR